MRPLINPVKVALSTTVFPDSVVPLARCTPFAPARMPHQSEEEHQVEHIGGQAQGRASAPRCRALPSRSAAVPVKPIRKRKIVTNPKDDAGCEAVAIVGFHQTLSSLDTSPRIPVGRKIKTSTRMPKAITSFN